MVLSPVEHADDGHRLRTLVHGIGNHGAPLVVGEPKTGADVFTRYTAQREQRQALAGRNDVVRVALGDRQRRSLGNVEEQCFELVARLGAVDDVVRRQAFADAFLRAAASRALTAPTPTARDGLALSAS